jgi:hypothetical protein
VRLAAAALGAALLAFAPLPSLAATIPADGSVGSVCRSLARVVRNFDVQQCLDAGLSPADLTSVRGHALVYRDFQPPGPATPKRVLLLGGIHGDELSSIAVVFQWVELLKADRFQRYEWRVLPCANPDGVLASPATRINARGVDINRNFPSPDWATRAVGYWKRKARSDPRRYPGSAAASEPETRWIAEQISDFKPDVIVSVHAPLSVLDFDGPKDPPKKLGYLLLQPLGVYPGSLGDYAGMSLKLPVITIELPQAVQPPSAAQSGRIWSDLIAWLDHNVAGPAH